MNRRVQSWCVFFTGVLIVPVVFAGTSLVHAQTEAERLQSEIADRNSRLSNIEAEIAQFEAALQEVGAEKNTLQSAIRQLELERSKVLADLSLTENKIGTTDLTISQLNFEITTTADDIVQNEDAIKEILRIIYTTDNESLVETLLRYDNLSEFWSTVESLETVKGAMGVEVGELRDLRATLEEKRIYNQVQREQLLGLKSQYSDQQQVLANNKAQKNDLLDATQSEEDAYQELLAEKQAARTQMLQEIRNYEAQLSFILDPNTIPAPGTAVFTWPVANPYITQYFGGTEFAKRNASVYGGRPYHPGVDFGAARGTQILAPLSGTVRATGNTDLVPGCLSWGQWTLIDHANGLSTLYAHQDLISVVPGQQVRTGEVIGYIGSTGFSTGPHLHFTLYVKEAVQVRQFNEIKTVTSCGAASSPFAATEAYLDPLDYLPTP